MPEEACRPREVCCLLNRADLSPYIIDAFVPSHGYCSLKENVKGLAAGASAAKHVEDVSD